MFKKILSLSTALVLVIAPALAAETKPAPISPKDFLQSWDANWVAVKQNQLDQQMKQLNDGLISYCAADNKTDLPKLQLAWRQSMLAWESFSGISNETLLARRTDLRIDFSPTRSKNIIASVAKRPKDLVELDGLGRSAKGFSALEWLLWEGALAPQTDACHYAVLLGQEISEELTAVRVAMASKAPDEQAFDHLYNQWLAAYYQLQWTSMTKPLLQSNISNTAPIFARAESHSIEQLWDAHWQTIKAFAIGSMPPGETAPISIEGYLFANGNTEHASALHREIIRVDGIMNKLKSDDRKSIESAADGLQGLESMAKLLAKLINVTVDFADQDGD